MDMAKSGKPSKAFKRNRFRDRYKRFLRRRGLRYGGRGSQSKSGCIEKVIIDLFEECSS